MKKAILFPIHILQVFTVAKSFRANPVIGSRFLNRMGLHVFRVTLAYGIMRFRMFCLSWGVPKKYRRQYYEKGYILIENAMDEATFQEVEREVRRVRSEVRECIQGNTLTQRIHLDEENADQTRAIQSFLNRKDIVRFFKFAAGKNHRPISHIQVIKSNYRQGEPDPQKHLHSDTFHPTMKYWLFLQDVGHNMAPFTYVEGSHRLTWKRLKWEYKKSVSIQNERIPYSQNGSFRIEEKELEALGLPAPREVCVSKNTLVIVNTFGFHRRGDTDRRSIRAEIWGISRTNPFNPWIGFDFAWMHRLENWALKQLRYYHDKQAEKRGRLPSWHVIDQPGLFDDPDDRL
jgi:hypothetical protein